MNVHRLRAANYRCYEDLDLELPVGLATVIGPNGSGKSSLIEIIPLALFGPPEGTRTLGPYLHDGEAETDVMVEVSFEHGGNFYRVRRGHSVRGNGKTTLDFEQCDEGCWTPLTRGTVKTTQEAVLALISIDRDAFCASSFLSQGDSGAFTEATPARRKELLANVIGLGVWDRLLGLARRDKRGVEDELQRIAGLLEHADHELAGREAFSLRAREAGDMILRLEQEQAEAKTALEQATARVREIAQARAELRELVLQRDSAEDRLTELRRVKDAATDATDQLIRLCAERDALPDTARLDEAEQHEQTLRARVEEHARLLERVEQAKREQVMVALQRRTLTAQVDELLRKAGRLIDRAAEQEAAGAGMTACRECGQTLGQEALTSSVAALRVEAREHRDAAADLRAQADQLEEPEPPLLPDGDAPTGELADATRTLRQLREAAVTAATLAERQKQLEATIGLAATLEHRRDIYHWTEVLRGLEAKVGALEGRAPTAADLEQLELVVVTAESNVRRIDTRLQQARAAQTRADVELDRLQKVATDAQEHRTRAATLQAELDTLTLLERAYGRNGIPALILETTAIPALEAGAQETLAQLGGKTADARVELRTQRALKTSDGLAETLDIVITTSDGTERAYEHWSGGERMRISLALRLALASLLAHRRGAESRIFVLDEPGDLDAQGKQALVELLRGLHARGMERVYLVSHDGDLRDAFVQTVEVRTDGERSWVETGAPVAVAA